MDGKTILEKVYKSELKLAKMPIKKRGTKRKKLKKGNMRVVNLSFCAKTYDLIRWWTQSTGQYMTTFVREAVSDKFMQQMDAREAKIAKMKKYYDEYFEQCTEEEALEAEKEAKELNKVK